MSGMFRALEIGISSLMASQRGIDVTSQNIANINTPGYQRQRANLRELAGPSGVVNPPILGQGVYAESVDRIVTPFVDGQMRRQKGISADATLTQDMLRDIESVLNEPSGTGIASALDDFWQSWQDLSLAPGEQASRISVLQSGHRLTATLSETHAFLESLHGNLDTRVVSEVDHINGIASEIAQINLEIIRANAVGGGPGSANPLEQRRDALLFDLAEITDYRVSFDDTGMSRIVVGNQALVDESGAQPVEIGPGGKPVWGINGSPFKSNSGRMNALAEMKDTTLPDYMDQLNSLAMGIRDQVNAIHRTGYGADNSTGLDFFVGADVSTLAVDPALEASPLSVATSDQPGAIGNNAIALAMGQLSTDLSMGGPPATLSFNAYFRSTISSLGMETQNAQVSSESSQAILNHLTDRRQAISGVSMDEEIAELLSFEKAFQAGGRIINVVDEMLDQVINRMGLVGR